MITKRFIKYFLYAIPFLWGYYFSVIFRFTMNTLYPYYQSVVHLSIFVLFLLSIIWISFFWYIFYHQRKRKKLSLYPFVLAVFNVALTFFLQYEDFEKIRYWYPLSVSLVLLIYFFILAYRLPFFIPFRIAFGTGIIIGIIPISFFHSPSNIFFIGTMIAIISIPYLRESPHFAPSGKNKMLPLRKNLDILRFSLMIISLYGIFDEYRGYFFGLLAVYTFGFILQYILYKFHKKRFHIRFGVISLGAFFLLFGIIFHFLPLHFSAALMYVFLANWETLYFKKSVDSYIEKEQLYLGFILLAGFLLYWVQYAWLYLSVTILILVIQVFVLRYVYKKYRRALIYLFLFSFSVWIYNAWYFSDNAAIEKFWISNAPETKEEIPDTVSLFILKEGSSITTNLFPREVIEDFNKEQHYFQFVECSHSYSFLTPMRYLIWNKIDSKKDHYYLCSIPQKSFYSEKKGRSHLFQFIKHYKISNIYFYHYDDHAIYYPTYSSVKPWRYNRKEVLSKAIVPIIYLTRAQARWYEKKNQYKAALFLYKKVLEYAELAQEKMKNKKKDASEPQKIHINRELIYKKLATFSAMNPPNMRDQIHYLLEYIHFRKDHYGKKIKEKILLMELYMMNNQREESYQCALNLIEEDPENAHSYYQHILKLILTEKEKIIRYQKLLKLEYRVKHYMRPDPENAQSLLYKDKLMQELYDAIIANKPINPFISIKESSSKN